MLLSGLIDLLIFVAITGFGAFLTRCFIQKPSRLEHASLAFPLGAGVLTWLAFLLSWLGVPLNLTTIVLFLALAFTIGFISLLAHRRVLRGGPDQAHRAAGPAADRRWPRLTLWISLVFVVALAVVVGLTRSYAEWDPLDIWSTKGYGIAMEGTIFAGQSWGRHSLAYPLNIPLLISFFRITSADLLPGSKLLFVAFYVSFLMGSFHFWRQQKVDPLHASLGALAFATVPIVFVHATTGYANLPFATYVVLGTLWGIQGLFEENTRAQWLSGVLLGLANWTRTEGIGFSLAVIAALMIAVYIVERKPVLPWRILLPSLLAGAVWLLFAGGYFEGTRAGNAVLAMIRNILDGNMHRYVPGVILGQFSVHILSIGIWGFLFPASLFFILLNMRGLLPENNPKAFSLLTIILIVAMYPAVLAYAASYIMSIPDFPVFIDRSFDRYFFPPAFLLGILGIWMLDRTEETQPSTELEKASG
jgi:hypothetical protein